MSYPAQFKFQTVLEALTAEKPEESVAREADIHPVTLSRWKQDFLEGGEEIFEDEEDDGDCRCHRDSGSPSKSTDLYETLVQHLVEDHLDIDDKIEITRQFCDQFGLNKMLRVLDLAKSTWYYRTQND